MSYENNTGYPSVTEILKPYIDDEWFLPEHAERGTAVHAACEAHIKGLYVIPLRIDWQPYFDSFRRWFDAVVDRVVLSEERLVDHRRGYCGKPDAALVLKGDNETSLWDWKTSQAHQTWWPLQGAGYRNLLQENGIQVSRGGSVRLKKDGSGCLIDMWPDNPTKHFNIFTGLLNAHNYFKKGR